MIINMKRRMTNQRLKILEYLQSVKTHPNAETVYQAVKKIMPQITLATVYRNLNLLADEGEILRMEINGEYHYDADMCCHQHCVCRECDKIIDVFQKEINEYAMKKIKPKKFKPECVMIIYSGLCNKCGGKNVRNK